MPEKSDLNALRGSGEINPEIVNKKAPTYEDYVVMTPEELARIADENDTTVEEFLKGVQFTEKLRKLHAKDSE